MENTHSDFNKLASQFEFPDKPQFGTFSSWFFVVFFAGLGVFCFCVNPKSDFIHMIWLIGAGLSVVICLILFVFCLKEYMKNKREYILAVKDFEAYQNYKALQFIKMDDKNRKDDEMYVEWIREHPDKGVPDWVKSAILFGNSLTIQQYLELVEEYKHKNMYEE